MTVSPCSTFDSTRLLDILSPLPALELKCVQHERPPSFPLWPSPSVSHGASYRSTRFVCITIAMGMTPKAPRGDLPQFSSVMFLNVECHHHLYASFSISDVHIVVHKVYSIAFVLRRERRTKNRCPNNEKKYIEISLIVWMCSSTCSR